jgi:hypothetical protein
MCATAGTCPGIDRVGTGLRCGDHDDDDKNGIEPPEAAVLEAPRASVRHLRVNKGILQPPAPALQREHASPVFERTGFLCYQDANYLLSKCLSD